nr:hypothetical protein [Tanacetum cinerariifolium]
MAEGYYFPVKALYVFERLWLVDISDGFYFRRVSSYPLLGISLNCNGSRDPCHIKMGPYEDICIGPQERQSLCYAYSLYGNGNIWTCLVTNIRGDYSKLLAAFFMARISLGLLDRLESSPWLGVPLVATFLLQSRCRFFHQAFVGGREETLAERLKLLPGWAQVLVPSLALHRRLGLVEVEARYANGVFSGVVAENTVVIIGTIRIQRNRRVLAMVAGKALAEKENAGFDIARHLPWFHRRPPAKGVGLRVADSQTGNNPKDDFTPLEIIRRSYSVIRERIPFELKGETFKLERVDRCDDTSLIRGGNTGYSRAFSRVPIQEELRALRDRVDVAEAKSASMRATIRTMREVKMVLCNYMRDERQTCIEIERQLASVYESHRQDRKDFKKLKDFMTSQYGYRS